MSTKETDNQIELLLGASGPTHTRDSRFRSAHRHAIARPIERISEEVLQVGHGSLYPAPQRLLKFGLIEAEDGISENNRRARFYRLTAKGRQRLSAETSKWQRFSHAIARILAPLAEESK